MPKVTVRQPYTLPVEEVREKVPAVLEETIKAFNGTDEKIFWSERSAAFTFNSMGFAIKGTGVIEEGQVVIEIELPFAALMFKSKVEQGVAKRLAKALEVK